MTSKQIKIQVAKSAAVQMCADIKTRMEAAGVTRTDLAFEAGESPNNLGDILNGRKNPGLARFITIIHALGVCCEKRFSVEIREYNELSDRTFSETFSKIPGKQSMEDHFFRNK